MKCRVKLKKPKNSVGAVNGKWVTAEGLARALDRGLHGEEVEEVANGKLTASMAMRSRVIRCGVKKPTLEKFSDAELLGIDWFAGVPDMFKPGAGKPLDEFEVLAPKNYYCLAFWDAYRRCPEAVLEIVSKVRSRNWLEGDHFTVCLKMLLREKPDLTDPELSAELSQVLGRNDLDVSTVKKARQRLMKSAKRSGTN